MQLRKNAPRPKASQRWPARSGPTASIPPSETSSKSETTRPRSFSSWEVSAAMKPSVDGTEAAVELPSSRRVTKSTGRWVVRPVMKTAADPKSGPRSMMTLRP